MDKHSTIEHGHAQVEATGKPTSGDDVMTLSEVADYLKVSEKTVLRMIRGGVLPAAKVSNQWRFFRSVVDEWMLIRMRSASHHGGVDLVRKRPQPLTLAGLVSPSRIVMNITPGTKSHVLAQLVRPLVDEGMVKDSATLLHDLLAREELTSTAIGDGVALPHARQPETCGIREPGLVIGICREGTDFEALDGHATYVFAMPCSTSVANHLRIMARIALLFKHPGAIEQLRAAESVQTIMDILAAADNEAAQASMSGDA